MGRTQELEKTISELGISLPKSYIDFLSQDDPDFELEIDNAYWYMATVLDDDWEGQEPLTLNQIFL